MKLTCAWLLLAVMHGEISANSVVDEFGHAAQKGSRWVSNQITNEVFEARNLDVVPMDLSFEGVRVTYQYQIWKVKPESVCAHHAGLTPDKSKCTIAAKKLFITLCDEGKHVAARTHTLRKHKQMYCNAALSYKPMIMSLGGSGTQSELANARQKCNRLILESQDDRSANKAKQTKDACDAYKRMK